MRLELFYKMSPAAYQRLAVWCNTKGNCLHNFSLIFPLSERKTNSILTEITDEMLDGLRARHIYFHYKSLFLSDKSETISPSIIFRRRRMKRRSPLRRPRRPRSPKPRSPWATCRTLRRTWSTSSSSLALLRSVKIIFARLKQWGEIF